MRAELFAGLWNSARLTAWSTAVLALGVLIAAFQLSETRRTRDGELAIRLSERLDDKDFGTLREELKQLAEDLPTKMRELFVSDWTTYQRYMSEADFFEDVGALYRRRVLSVRLIELVIGSAVRDRWKVWDTYLREIREPDEHGDAHPTWYSNFERLAVHLELRAQKPSHKWRRLLSCWLQLRLGL